MIERLEDYLIGFALGIRFRANFSIEDQLGKIIDKILYSENSFFNPHVFPRVRNLVGKKILFNEITQDKLHLDNSNIILEINFIDDSSFGISDMDNILKQFNEQIIKGIMKDFTIKEISRIGYIKRYLFNLNSLAKSFVDKTIGMTLEGVNDINLSFSKKIPMAEALIKKDINDFENVIFNIVKKADLSEIFMSIDFQQYYDPFLPSYQQIYYDKFVSSADIFNKKKYLDWLNSNYMEGINE